MFFADTWYKCYLLSAEEVLNILSKKLAPGGTNDYNHKLVCESHKNFVFTKGDESKARGCSGKCWCCQPDDDGVITK